MKPFYFITAFLCLYAFGYSQTNKVADGNYVFGKAIATVYNSDTKAEVLTQVFNDTVSLEKLNELPLPIQPIFLSACIREGVLIHCTLWNDYMDYSVEGGQLLVSSKPPDSEEFPENQSLFSLSYHLPPIYKLELDDHTATFTFTQPYGNSLYSFPLEGKWVIVLVKDESK
jgi:cytochrome oxidase Cu insertion factor (SCO1/SenC/PrrC family)